MKKSAKRILCGALSLTMCSTLVVESVLRLQADNKKYVGSTTASASFEEVTGLFDTSKLREDYFNDSVLKTEDLEPVYETRTVMVSLSGATMVERAKGEDITEYAKSWSGELAKSEIAKEQTVFLQALKQKGVPYKLERSYDTVLNGVAIEIDTEYVSLIKQMKGVESVVITTAYILPQEATGEGTGEVVTNVTNVRDTGIYDADEYTAAYGSGTVVAVLDTGLDYTHAAFQGFQTQGLTDIAWSRETVKKKMETQELSSEKKSGSLDVADVYLSEKVPFAYDYADDDPDVYPSYSNHGTHVAGIIGGYDPSGYTDKDGVPSAPGVEFLGVVPDAQLMICKVFTDDLDDPDLGGAVSEDIVAALDDCVKLGVDVINMSLGSSCGFTTTNDGDSEGEMLNEVYTRIGEAGISLICAASNDYSAGYGGVYGTNLTSNPDAGTVGSPSTFASALSVASINGQKASYVVANNKTSVFFEEARDINSNPMEFVENITKNHPECNGEFTYVVVGGVGDSPDYTAAIAGQLKGDTPTIALIKRGDTTFEDKVKLAKEMGAEGVIVYNNVAGVIRMNLGEIEDPIPAISISMNAGLAMANGAKKTQIQYKDAQGNTKSGQVSLGTIKVNTDYKAGPFMSEFSSWGPTPDLKLKPEITAHGGEIISAVPGGYDEQSGTSMATPNMAGFMAVVRSYIKKNPTLAARVTHGGVINTQELNALAMQLTMSTAATVYDQEGLAYSPRKQGAGVAKMENIIGSTKAQTQATGAFLWTEDNASDWEGRSKDGRPKVELGDMLHEKSEIKFTFEITNFGDRALSFETAYELMTETVSKDGLTVNEQAYLLQKTGSGITFTASGEGVNLESGVLTVEAGKVGSVTATITIGEKDRKYIEDSFENGMYVEGFATLKSKTSGQCDLNLPFLGFYGDWEQAPMLDYSAYEVAANAQDSSVLEEDKIKASVWATQPYNIYYNDKYVLPMGGYLYLLPDDADPMYVDEDHNSVSRYNDYVKAGDVNNYMTTTGIKAVYAGLLRNARYVNYKLYDETTGELLMENTLNRVAKAYAGGGSAVPANVKLELYPETEGWIANGQYKMTFEFIREEGVEMPENTKNTFEFSFTVDYEAPIMQDARVRYYNYKDGNKQKQNIYLDIDVYDNHYAQTLMLCYPNEKDNAEDVTVQLLTDYPTPIRNAVKNGVTTVSIDITDIYEKYGDQLYVQIDDYALNTCLYKIDIDQANKSILPSGRDTFTLGAGQDKITVDQYGTHQVEIVFGEQYKGDFDKANLEWRSNNPAVAKVKNGEIVGVKAGKTKISVTNGTGTTQWIEVTVTEQEAYLSKFPTVSFGTIQTDGKALTKAQGMVEVSAGKNLELSILPDPWYHPMEGIRVRWESNNQEVAKVDANVTGTSNVIQTIKKGTATVKAVLQEQTSSGAWKDTLYTALVTLRVQEEFTVSNYTLTAYNGLGYNAEDGYELSDGVLKIPDDMNVMTIGEEAFKDNNNIRVLVISDSVTQIQPRAFLNCTALEEVYFVSTTQKAANEPATAKVSMIYEEAFKGCINLKKVDFSHVKTVTLAQKCFEGCAKLETVVDMPSIGTMHHEAFAGTALTSVDLSGLHMSGERVFADCEKLTTITDTSKFSAIGKEMFSGCTSLSGTITLKTPKVGEKAFEGCTKLEKVIIDSSVKELDIGARAFERCGKEAGSFAIEIQEGATVRSIGQKAFINAAMQDFDFSTVKGLELLGENAFQNTGITTITLTDDLFSQVAVEGSDPVEFIYQNVRLTGIPFEKLTVKVALGSQRYATSADGNVIYDTDKKTILYVNPSLSGEYAIENGVEAIGDYAFAGSNVTKVTLSDSVTSIGVGAFENAKLTAFNFGDASVTKISASAFEGSKLKTIALPAGITEIGASAFANSALSSISVTGNAITSIGDKAFFGCKALEKVDFSALTLIGVTARSMGDLVFAGCEALTEVKLPSLTQMGRFTFSKSNLLTSVTFGEGSTTVGSYTFASLPEDYDEFTKGVPEDYVALAYASFAYGVPVKTVDMSMVVLPVVEKKVQPLGMGLFNNCQELTSVKLPANCTEIGDYAFSGCIKLTSVVGLEDVQKFGNYAFYNTKLSALNLEEATHIGVNAFASYERADVENPTAAYTTLSIPKAVEIGEFAFYNGGVSQVQLPNTLKKLGAGAFASSDKLESVTVESGSEYFTVIDGVLYRYTSTDKTALELVYYPTARVQALDEESELDRTHVIVDGTVRIMAYAYYNLNQNTVNKVVLPYSVKAVGDKAFLASGIKEYTFESIKAPTLEESYSAEVRAEMEGVSSISNYKGYYNANFQYYLYNFTKYGGLKSDLVMNYPCNGTGYDNLVYTTYFGTRNASEAPMLEDNTRAFIRIINDLPTVDEVKAMMSWNVNDANNLAKVQELSALMKTARGYYKNALMNEGQKGFITEELETTMLEVETELRAVKKRFGIKTRINQLLVAADSTHKAQYNVGETFDMNGLSIIVEYDDYSQETADSSKLTLLTTGKLADYIEAVEVEYQANGERKRVLVPVKVLNPNAQSGPSIPERTSGNENTVIILSVVLVACAAIAVGVVVFMKKKYKKSPAGVETQENAPVDSAEEPKDEN